MKPILHGAAARADSKINEDYTAARRKVLRKNGLAHAENFSSKLPLHHLALSEK
jgi:hypothetical protein